MITYMLSNVISEQVALCHLRVRFLMLILFLPIKNAFHIYIYTNSKKELQKAKYVISSGVCIIVAHLVYEIPYAQFLWVFWGYLLAGSRNNEYRSEY